MLFIEATTFEVILIIITSLVGIFSLSAALEGYMFRRLRAFEIIPLIVGGLLMIYPGHVSDTVGFVLVAAVTIINILLAKKDKKPNRN
jgi:TRAP-type uncharacterized transport system fused permease subunit